MVHLHRNTWGPDTCSCVLEYEFDEDLDPTIRTHKLVAVHNACLAHADVASHIGEVLESQTVPTHVENIRKNTGLDELAAQLGLPADSTRWEKLQQYLNRWYYDTSSPRVLHIVTKGLTAQQKSRAQSAADTRFGVGKIIIE